MPYGFTVWDEDRRLALWNDSYLEMYHLPAERIRAGMSLREVAEVSAATGDHGDMSVDDITAAYEDRFRHDGGRRAFEHRSGNRDIRTTNTRMPGLGWVVTHQDITDEVERNRAAAAREIALAQEAMRLDAAVNNMTQGLVMFGPDRRLIICNARYAEMYELPPEMTRRGTTLEAQFDYRVANGTMPPGESADAYVPSAQIARGETPRLERFVERCRGRVISVINRPMADGGWLSTHQDITEEQHREELIRHLARHDALTDLPNRVFFKEEMARLAERLEGGEAGVALLCIDLDRFKLVNDTLGHGAGDRVLVCAANLLRAAVREGDLVARLGGDEFAILTGPLGDRGEAEAIAARVVDALAAPLPIEGSQIVVGASVGVAVAPFDASDSQALLRNADLALYRAKRDGRGTYRFFERGMDEALRERRALEASLSTALERGELRLLYQPVVSLADNRISSVEALLRWDHPERGPIPPTDFIPIAEETGLIIDIGAWVLGEAAHAAARWPEDVRIAVNLSVAQFRGRNLVETVERAVRRAGLAPHRLELEITESLLLGDSEATFALLHRLRDMGVRIAMDDFGTGYSSLSYLRRFPFDKIKIDRSFMPDLSEAEGTSPIVEAMIGLGRSLGMTTTAEGVETETQLELVRRQGCAEAQGFLFCPPLPASAIETLLRSSYSAERLRLTG